MRNGADTKACSRPVMLSIQIPADQHSDLVELAKLNRCGTATFVQHIIQNHLKDLYESATRHEHS